MLRTSDTGEALKRSSSRADSKLLPVNSGDTVTCWLTWAARWPDVMSQDVNVSVWRWQTWKRPADVLQRHTLHSWHWETFCPEINLQVSTAGGETVSHASVTPLWGLDKDFPNHSSGHSRFCQESWTGEQRTPEQQSRLRPVDHTRRVKM